ncbi:MAG: thioredoxin family protein, partial [Bacteroidales bacterium]|nr:thioredoxin family protein [Bacteroidales bacterium]
MPILKRDFLAAILLIISGFGAKAQIYDPVTWSFGYEKTGSGSYELIFTATIEEGSHMYALEVPDDGPIPTSIVIDTVPEYSISGMPFEVTKPEELFDEAFGFKIRSYSNTAEFRQSIKGNVPSFTVKGLVNYMACNNATCSPPKDVEFEIRISDGTVNASGPAIADVENKAGNSGSGLLKFLLISLLAGFAGVLTPCVFPMIPMTVAFFSQGSENRSKSILKAIVFGISIVVIYSMLGIIVSLTSAGAGFANALSTHWIPNTIFFLLFVIFASSFFGAFEIVLPNSWVSGADSRVDKGGIVASFFMGLTTVIVSFSCTGPIVGALLVEAATGDVLRPTLGMLGFGIAFAMPFTFFALFPSVMSKLPRSGGWLNSVKVVLGFLMLAFSMKFLMTIDGVYALGLLSRDLFIAIWIALFLLLGLYLLGKIKFSHDSELKHIGTFRLFVIIAVFSFVIYLVPGLFGAPLSALSSFLPATSKSEFNLSKLISETRNPGAAPAAVSSLLPGTPCSEPKYSDKFEMPLGLSGYFEYRQGLECARELGKPVLLDFKGHACANCKLMEAKVWSDPEVLRRLRENFVIVALYVDDRTQADEAE